jgi:hypothetical protein
MRGEVHSSAPSGTRVLSLPVDGCASTIARQRGSETTSTNLVLVGAISEKLWEQGPNRASCNATLGPTSQRTRQGGHR